MSKNSIDKRITYGTIKDPTFNIYRKGGPVEDKPKPNNVLNFPIKPNMPLYDWYKSNKKEFKQVASIDDIGPFLTKFVSELLMLASFFVIPIELTITSGVKL